MCQKKIKGGFEMTKEEAINELKEDKALYMPKEWIEDIDRDTPDGRLITALDMAIKALETVEEFEKAQIITGGRLNGRTYAYKCGLEDGKRKALEQQPSNSEIPNNSTAYDCVSRQAVLKGYIEIERADGVEVYSDKAIPMEYVKSLPPVTPTQCIAAVRFSKEDLRDICNERIEIECTHGTCKDCKHIYCEHHEETCDIDEYNPNFYCADFEKRGNEND